MTESRDANEAAWYDITIAGKQFNISSRHGEAHIRNVERFLDETMEQIGSRLQNRSVVNVALLTALNLADQLLLAQSEEASSNQDWARRLETIAQRLTDALDKSPTSGDIAS